MSLRRPLAVFLSLALCSTGALAQGDYSKVQVTTEKLSSNTYMLTGAGGNLGLSVGEDAIFLIDDQFGPMTPKLQAAIAAISKKPIRFLLNTHWHFDHTGGNENFGKAGALIVAHENVRKRMSSDQTIEFMNMPIKASPKVALPVVTFSNDISFQLNGENLYVFHVPNGHTDGDAIVHFKTSNVVHMGDIYFNKIYPFIDTSSGGTPEGIVAAVDRVLALTNESTRFIPGHGPLGTRADLVAYRAMVDSVSTRVKTLAREGKTLAQVQDAKPTAEFDAVWGGGFLPGPQFVEMLYKGIKR